MRAGGRLCVLLGERALEILVIAGTLKDVGLVEEITRVHPVTPVMLDSVARFGHAGTWAFLASYLMDPVLAPAASRALRALFGDCMVDDDRLDASWELAVAKLGLDPVVRYRHGQRWTRKVAEHDARRSEHSSVLAERRHDELRARGSVTAS